MSNSNSSNLFSPCTNEVGLGLSTLRSLAIGELDLAKVDRLAVPDKMIRLAELVLKKSVQHIHFLERLIVDFQPHIMQGRSHGIQLKLASSFASKLIGLRDRGRLRALEQIDEIVVTNLGDSFHNYEISLSPPSSFVRDYLAKLYSWSLKEKGLVLERGRRVLSKISHQITTIHFPDRLASFFRVKDQFSSKLFSYVGGRPAKYFVCVAVAGLGLTYVPASVAGLVIAVVDP